MHCFVYVYIVKSNEFTFRYVKYKVGMNHYESLHSNHFTIISSSCKQNTFLKVYSEPTVFNYNYASANNNDDDHNNTKFGYIVVINVTEATPVLIIGSFDQIFSDPSAHIFTQA